MDPVAGIRKMESRTITPKPPRRALAASEIGALPDAALRRPWIELGTVRHGPRAG